MDPSDEAVQSQVDFDAALADLDIVPDVRPKLRRIEFDRALRDLGLRLEGFEFAPRVRPD